MNLKIRRLKPQASGQGMVEFALILPLLLLVTFGIIELGRMLFIYTSVHAASREAARYAAASGETPDGQPCYYLDTVGITAAAERIAGLSGATVSSITYDEGPVAGGTPTPITPVVCDDISLGDRVNVTVSGQYDPLLGLTSLQSFPIVSITSRTILKEISIYGNPAGGGGSPVLVVQITQPNPATYYDEGSTVPFNAVASGGSGTYVSWVWTSDKDGQISTAQSFSTSSLSIGTHVITVRVTDSAGATAQAQIVFGMRGIPDVTIISPVNGHHYQLGNPITFNGTAFDVEDGDITANLDWKELGAQFGTGGSFTDSTFATGSHTITAEVTDTSGLKGTATVTFWVDPNLPPVVNITSPADGLESQPNDLISFSGTAIDALDGDLSSSIIWTSSRDGQLFIGASFSTNTLSGGTHVITAQATDQDPDTPLTGSDSIVVFVTDHQIPEIEIRQPTQLSFYYSQPVTFEGWAQTWNSSGGNWKDVSGEIDWTIDEDTLFTGSTRTFPSPKLPVGTHIIRATIEDDQGVTNWDEITLTIREDPAPVVTITLPTASQSYLGDAVTFAGTATDVPQGDLSSALVWKSSLMASNIGTGASFTTSSLVAGTHTITATVTDQSDNIGFATKSFIVKQLVCPTPDQLIVETTGSAPIRAKYSWGMSMPSVAGGTAVLDSLRVTWVGGTLEFMSWESGPVPLYSGSTTVSPKSANQNIPLEDTWSGRVSLVFLFSNEPQNNRPITFEAQYRGCPLYSATYNN